MSFAKSLIETHMNSDQAVIEFEINQENSSQVVSLFNEFLQMGMSPTLEDRNDQTFLVVDIMSYKKKMKNVISLNIAKSKKSKVIEVDFVNKKRK